MNQVKTTLDRVIFLQEASSILSHLVIRLELDRVYSAEEIGHCRAFCHLFLKEPKHKIWQVVFGFSDRSDRMKFESDKNESDDFCSQEQGLKHGWGAGAWERYLDL